ncbi:ribosome biogenesis GTPase [Clostridium sp. USBA 49]|jgi:ribosome biogenesis GTPase|uniref:ribosome small subunit-dependent GTPase A n=1 Tax=Clostridium TaxID=1485 RepID=UPI00099AB912|nr:MULTISPECIES: ribosome small subunit-dependent GTPase A [Clostridium]SKA76231.1 ribosome biogenesis GTPase [Clostridium sp. USBA 49]
MEGTIIKGIAGFYYVKSGNKIIECKARGKFRFNELTPIVGDKVEIDIINNKGIINKIYPRKSELIRPSVANVTQVFVIFTFLNPKLNLELLNKFLILCEYNNLKAIVCFNKIDLIEINEFQDIVNMIKKAKYEVLFLNAKLGYGIDLLKDKLKNNITVLCGPSGVGKSTILNQLLNKNLMETGEISEKIGRGKHTTRHSELVEIEEGFLVDTPGFTSLEMNFMSAQDLQYCFPDFKPFLSLCKFRGCTHYKEPECAIKQKVEEGKIDENRYKFYIKMLQELTNRRYKK